MRRVLIVDDDSFILEGMKRVLGQSFEVDTADSGSEGLYKLSELGPFATVISDMNMRGMTGVEFLERARTVAPLTTRVMMTAYADPETLAASINRASVFRFLNKPVARREFVQCLNDGIAAYDAALATAAQTAPSDMDAAWLEKALARADFDEEFSINFQPRVASVSGVPHGVEALIRWHHPERGFISPVDFIPVAERGTAIRDLTNWVLLGACRAWTDWQYRHDVELAVSVNVSPALLADSRLVGMVRSAVSRSGIDPNRLELEITEGLEVQDGHKIRETISGLKALGVKLSIDDFGTGFASMSQLQSLDVDCVKIDRSFVTNAPDNAKDQAILRSVSELGRTLGLKTVAEGIEVESHESFIRDLGIDEMQGYRFSKPLPSDQLIPWVGERYKLLSTTLSNSCLLESA